MRAATGCLISPLAPWKWAVSEALNLLTLGDSVELSSVPGDATVLQPMSQTVGMSVPVAEPGAMQLDVADSEIEDCFGLDEAFNEDKKLDLVIGEAFV